MITTIVGSTAIIKNKERDCFERGIITRTWRRKETRFYDVRLERGTCLEAITEHTNNSFYIYKIV